jgi:uncharacterized delta-60 repeat protein
MSQLRHFVSIVFLLATTISAFGQAGNVDPSFTNLISANVNCAAMQPDGKLVIGGSFTTINSQPRNYIARFNADGTLESTNTFNAGTGPNGQILNVAIQSDGKILVCGYFNSVNGQTRNGIARLNPNGTVESTSTFNPGTGATLGGGPAYVYSFAIQSDGKIVVGGFFTEFGGQSRNYIARLNGDGTVESTSTFSPGTGANNTVYCVALQPDGKILLVGFFNAVNGLARNAIARLNSNGTVESTGTFNTGTGFALTGSSPLVFSLAIQPDGKILVGGQYSSFNGQSRNCLARLNADGTLDSGFAPNGAVPVNSSSISSMALQTDGKILIGGGFTSFNGQSRNNLVRLNSDGTLESSFNSTGANNQVSGLQIQSDGRILAGGYFTSISGQIRSNFARLNNDAASQTLSATDQTRVQWLRSGAVPETLFVTFDLSTDGGLSYTALGNATRFSGGWEKTGLNLPIFGIIRARCRLVGGYYMGSSGWMEQVASYSFCPSISLSPNVFPGGVLNSGYTSTVTASGGTGPYIIAKTSGNLPPGLSLSGGGVLSGTPTNLGSFSFALTATAANGCTGTSNYSVNVVCPVIGLTPAVLPTGVLSSSYGSSLSGDGGTAPYTFGKTSGNLPPGLSLSSSGSLSGVPTNLGSFSFTITATDSYGCAGGSNYTLDVVCPSITLAPTTLPGGTVGSNYNRLLTASGGTASYTFAKTLGELPTGLSLSSGGTLSGVPTTNGDFTFTIQATDTTGCSGLQSYTQTVTCPSVTIAPAILPDGAAGVGFGTRLVGANGAVYAAVAQPDGKVVIGGTFTAVNNVARHGLARLNADGSVDGSFDPNPDAGVLAVVVQPNGKVLIGGDFTTLNGTLRSRIARLEMNGNVDSTFDTGNGADGTVTSITLHTNGQVLISGWFDSVNGFTRHRIARLDNQGHLDNGFDPGTGPNDVVQSIALQPNGQVVFGGRFTSINGTTRNHIARLNSNGSLDASFNPGTGADDLVNSVVVQNDRRVLLGGQFSNVNGTPRKCIARLDEHGALDTSFDPGSGVNGGILNSLAVQPDGNIVIAGYFTNFNGTPRNGIARVDRQGNLDSSFNPGAGITDFVQTVSLQSDGKILVGGYFTSINGMSRNRIGRVNGNGALDEGYDQQLTASGANPPYNFTASGTLPPGLSLSSDGVLSGTAASPGSYSFTVTETDTYGCAASRNYTVAVGCPAVVLGPNSLPGGFAGVAYAQGLMASGSAAPYEFKVAGGSLPDGLSLSTNGVISGTPASSGNFSFTITATNSSGCGGTRGYTLAVGTCPTITLSPSTLPDGTFGASYSNLVNASGGVAPYALSITSGSLPAGLDLSPAGLLSGTPGAPGSNTFTITATDVNGCASSRSYTLNISCSVIALSPVSLSDGTLGSGYSQTLTATGGAGGYQFASIAGTLPPGLALASGGLLSGTPTNGGGFTFTVQATDTNGCSGSNDYTVFIVRSCTSSFSILHTFGVSGDGAGTKYDLIRATDGLIYGVTLRGGNSDAGTVYRIAPDGGYSTLVALPWNNSNHVTEPYFSSGRLVQALDGNLYGLTEFGGDSGNGTMFRVTPSGLLTKVVSFDGSIISFPLGHGLVRGQDGNLYGKTAGQAFKTTLGGTVSLLDSFDDATVGHGGGDLILGSDGNLYGYTSYGAPQDQGTIFKLKPTGELTVLTGQVPHTSAMMQAADGNFYAASGFGSDSPNGAIFRVTLSGEVTRLFTFNRDNGSFPATGLVEAPDGKIYGITVEGGSANYGTIYRFTPSGVLEVVHNFVRSEGTDVTGLVLGSDGRLYGVANDDGPANQGTFFRMDLGCPSLTLSPSAMPSGMVGVSYSQSLSVDNGIAPYAYGISSGTLPPGLSLANAVLSGTPTITGTSTFTVRVVDRQGYVGSRAFTIDVVCPVVTLIPPSPLHYGTVGTPYTQVLSVNGVAASFNFTQPSGTLPSGLTLSGAGLLSGTPTTLGDYQFTVQAADPFTGQCSGSQNYFLTVAITLDVPARQPDGSVQFTVHLEPGRTYTVQSSVDLITWHDLMTFTATSTSQTVSDPAPDLSRGYYRVVSP